MTRGEFDIRILRHDGLVGNLLDMTLFSRHYKQYYLL